MPKEGNVKIELVGANGSSRMLKEKTALLAGESLVFGCASSREISLQVKIAAVPVFFSFEFPLTVPAGCYFVTKKWICLMHRLSVANSAAPRTEAVAFCLLPESAAIAASSLTLLLMLAGEVIDSSVMSRRELMAYFHKEIADAKEQDILFSLHLKVGTCTLLDCEPVKP